MAKDVDYSNREIDNMFNEIMNTLKRIEEQTIKTNGRVNTLEIWRESLMAKLAGVIATITIGWTLAKEFIFK